MKNGVKKFKRAGVWNILCGVLVTLAFVGIYVVMGVDFSGGDQYEIEAYALDGVLFAYVGAYLWEILIIFPCAMILAGSELISKHKKGVGVRLFLVFNVLMKILSAGLNGLFGLAFIATSYPTAMVYGAFLTFVALMIIISIFVDIPAIFAE